MEGMETAKWVCIDSEIVNMNGYTEVFPEYSGRKHGRKKYDVGICPEYLYVGISKWCLPL